MKIIGLGFVARSGKDTIADYLVRQHGYRKSSFIENMKEACRIIFGFNERQLYGDLKEVVDGYWDDRLDIYQSNRTKQLLPGSMLGDVGLVALVNEWIRVPFTPRLAFQLMGTEAGRNVFGADLWVHSFIRKVQNSGHDLWVMADVRFPNEADAILRHGGTVYQISRHGAEAKGGADAHPSETAMIGYTKWTGFIQNDGTLAELFAKADTIA